MKIRAMRLQILTSQGRYGFHFSFTQQLNIVRGNNSSGKSTFFNCLLYALGMEELVGGRGEKVLQYAVKDNFLLGHEKVMVDSSEVLLEVESKGQIVTFRRAIKHPRRESKLVEVFDGARLSGSEISENDVPIPTYLHDPGSASRDEGFYSFLEKFLGLTLPQVPRTNGGEGKLYLQAIFAAHAVEQKRGWTDYIANIPFFGLRDARTRVVEFILGLSTFDSAAKRARLDSDSVALDRDWTALATQVSQEVNGLGFTLSGLPQKPRADFDGAQVRVSRLSGNESASLRDVIDILLAEHANLAEESVGPKASHDLLPVLEAAEREVRRLELLHERASASLSLDRASSFDLSELLAEVKGDLERNKSARKLRELGAANGYRIAGDICPTCQQSISDSLVQEATGGFAMDIDANVSYLDSQRKMLEGQISALSESVLRGEASLRNVTDQLVSRRDAAIALRSDMGSTELVSRARLRRMVVIELEVARLQAFEVSFDGKIAELSEVAERLARNQASRKGLPKDQYSEDDVRKIRIFEKYFRANAQSFGYTSAEISEIRINQDNLLPVLSDIELREIVRKASADIRSDSSASDFVRLIWSYLISLYETASTVGVDGNHAKMMLMDEPGQHSMREESQRALFLSLSSRRGLQSIVAASFEDSDFTYQKITDNVEHNLITWDGKLIKSLG